MHKLYSWPSDQHTCCTNKHALLTQCTDAHSELTHSCINAHMSLGAWYYHADPLPMSNSTNALAVAVYTVYQQHALCTKQYTCCNSN